MYNTEAGSNEIEGPKRTIEAPIDLYINTLFNAAEDLNVTIVRLTEKLNPVLNPERFSIHMKEMESQVAPDDGSYGQSPYAGRINANIEKIRAAHRVIDALIDGMEV